MNTAFSTLLMLTGLIISGEIFAQDTPIIVTPPAAVVTTIPQSPEAPIAVTQVIPESASMMTSLKDGSQLEIDSDNSVYIVYSDGARVEAPDGIETLQNGSTIAIKDGKRIP